MIFAPSIPLQFDDSAGFKNVEDLKELVRFHLTNLLLTNPGEKISDPSYGVGLRQYLFENQTQDVYSRIQSEIETQIRTKLSYLKLNGVLVRSLSNFDNMVSIKISYNISQTNEQDVLEVGLNLDSGNLTFMGGSY